MSDKICGFCGSLEKEVEYMIAGKDANICSNCVDLSLEIIQEQKKNSNSENVENKNIKINFTPKSLKEHLDLHVIGQDSAKEELATAAYNHFKRLKLNDNTIHKSNGLIIGPSGSGKTLLAQSLANYLSLPFYIADATQFTETGYNGDDVSSVLTSLLLNADGDIEKAQKGIIFIDEIDKIGTSAAASSGAKDVSGKSVQEELLKMMEGGDFYIPTSHGKKHMESKILFNTNNILFIFSGAFEGIYDIVEKRLNLNPSIGFGNNIKENKSDKYALISEINHEDIIKYGFIKEFIARISFNTYVNKLTKEDIKKVLTEPKNSIFSSFKKLVKVDGLDLSINDDAIDYIVDKAYALNMGGRALKNIMEKSLKEIMFNSPDYKNDGFSKITITRDYLEGKASLLLEKQQKNSKEKVSI